MKLRKIVHYLAFVVGISLAVGVYAADKAKKSAPPMDEKAAMEAMQKAATPGEAHKKLEPLVGSFDVKSKAWMDPSKPPEETTGTAERKWVLGGRFVQEEYNGTMMGQPFTGMGLQGYDNVMKKYVTTWVDNMGTSISTTTGTMNGNVMKFTGSMADPMTGKTMKYRMNLTVADNDHHTLEMWGPGPDGKDTKWMEISYTRKK